jgi:hypothetical protein
VNLKTVCLLLSLGHAGAAAALGLGELDVRSRLGQPLHATVTILGASAAAAADCFSLAPGNNSIAPPLRAQLSIEQTGEQTLLHIRTPQAVQDPIAQFVLVSDCGGRLQRDYVVLLDPPEQVAPAVSPAATVPTAAPTVADSTPREPVSQARPRRAAPRASSAPRPLQPAVPVARAAKVDSTPRLVLSGRPHTADAPFALRLDTNLPDLARPRPVSLTATELSDENTALSRKLAHLEAQLLALQQRNTELEARRAAAPAVAAPPVPGQPAQWPLYLLFTGLIAGAGTLVVWLRLSRHPPPLILDDAPWTETPAMPKPEAGVAPQSQPEPRWPEIAPPTLQESTEIKDDILDQAEVYMAHGHGDLAMHLLQEHLREAPTESPVPWLLLLDLLHRSGDVEGYAAASAECRRHFNVNLTGHPISQDSEPSQGLEAYPHLLDRLVEEWNTPRIDDFFKELIYDQRGGTRIGFEPGAYRDILLLRAIAHEALPLAA